ncbi:hypothetical protein [Nioella aestuarii]|uniref:hypothetical protein n=1 Tax=Nioella aestuarii TaxID=1662864 RepID=UPI003D7FE95D
MADTKTFQHRSYLVASFNPPNMITMRLRRMYRRLSDNGIGALLLGRDMSPLVFRR